MLYVGAKLNSTWLIENLEEGKKVKVLVDQYVSPTLNTNLTGVLLEIAERRATGILHTSGQPE
jgi:dTDP-4-dehydrorhamnose reductase